MNIRELQKNWDEFGKIDPLWAILTLPDKKGRKWQLEKFFLTGIKTIKLIMESIESLGINIRRRRALDFGCGVMQSFPIMEMYGMNPEYIFKFLIKNKAKIVTIIDINVIEALKRQESKKQNFIYFLYYVTK